MQLGVLTLPLAIRIFLGAAALIVPIAALSVYFIVDNATRACRLAKDNLPEVINPVVAAGIGNPQAANMETS